MTKYRDQATLKQVFGEEVEDPFDGKRYAFLERTQGRGSIHAPSHSLPICTVEVCLCMYARGINARYQPRLCWHVP